jgi:hypothetical protein
LSDALEALDHISEQLAALTMLAATGRSKYLPGSEVQPITRAIAATYFQTVRSVLQSVEHRQGLPEEIDFVVQGLLELSTARREKQAYVGQIRELRPYLLEATVEVMKSRGAPALVLSDTERAVLKTLGSMLPGSAASYEQALRDIAQGGKVSWRGTAVELRETLRDVMDHLAPDDKVKGAPGFQLEAGQTGPTQKQKVRFSLRARKSSGAALAVAEASLVTVDEAVATLARSTYQRGSASTHAPADAKEIRNLKRYVDALLGELLEIA